MMKLVLLLASACALVAVSKGAPPVNCAETAKKAAELLEPVFKCYDDTIKTNMVKGFPACLQAKDVEDALKMACENPETPEQVECVGKLTAGVDQKTLEEAQKKCGLID